MKQSGYKIAGLLILVVLLTGCTFAGTQPDETPGFFMGIWHGIIAPFTLIVRWFTDIQMYAIPNTGFTYDLGFILGLIGSIPIGWLATLISLGFYFFA